MSNKAKGDTAHKIDVLLERHVQTAGDDGACLQGSHESRYVANNSCSHRWQAYRQAEDISHRYNWPAYRSIFETIISDSAKSRSRQTKTRSKKGRRVYMASILRSAFRDTVKTVYGAGYKAGDEGTLDVSDFANVWDLDKSVDAWDSDAQAEKPCPNFRKRDNVPYWHQAHHLIPSSLFRNALLNSAGGELDDVYFLARKGLLAAKYNHNGKDNMIILPMQDVVADALRLPVHTTAPQHDAYDRRIKQKLDSVLQEYAAQIALKAHDEDVPAFTKAQLVSYSKDLFSRIANGIFISITLDDLPDAFFPTSLLS